MNPLITPLHDLGVQRCGVLTVLPRMIEEYEIDPDPVLSRNGFQRDDFLDPERALPYANVLELLDDCARTTKRDDFGLALGLKARLDHLGLVGKLMQNSPNFNLALKNYIANHCRFVRGGVPYIVHQSSYRVNSVSEFVVGYCCIVGSAPTVQFCLAAMGVGSSIFFELTGQRPKRVLLALSKHSPLAKSAERVLAPTPVVFESPHYGLVYPTALLARVNARADAESYEFLSAAVQEYWNGLEPDFVDQVRRSVLPSLFVKTSQMRELSNDLRIHSRTINRRLKEKDTTLRTILNEMRYEIASQLLRNTSLSVSAVADALGYAEASVFVRTFQRWSGQTPERWRKSKLT